MSSNDGIYLRIDNSFRKVLDLSGDSEYRIGTTTIEADSCLDGNGVDLYIQNKGFGRTSSPSVRTIIDNDTAAELVEFLQRHLELSAKV
jgi:hypothetical protein